MINTGTKDTIDHNKYPKKDGIRTPFLQKYFVSGITLGSVKGQYPVRKSLAKIENGKHKRPDGRNASSICEDYGQSGSFGEVMGRYQETPDEIVTGWHNSATHYACMTSSKYNRVGVGIAADSEGYLYWVAIFMD